MADRLSPPPPKPGFRRFSSSAAVAGRVKFPRARVRRPRNHQPRSSTTPSPDPANRNYEPALSSTSHMADDDGDSDDDDSDQERQSEPAYRGRLLSDPTFKNPYSGVFDDDDERKPLTYSSLPSTPVTQDAPPLSAVPRSPLSPMSPPAVDDTPAPFSLWDYLREELLATDFDSHQEMKWERVSNFLSIPVAVEKLILFGFVLCFDSFLYTFTIQPIRFLIALWRVFVNFVTRSKKPLPPSQKADLLRTLLVVLSIILLAPLTNASKIYHSIRGQDTIKLYVIFNALEIADRLCASIGQDILDCLFSRSNLTLLSRRVPFTTRTLSPVLFFTLATVYTVTHAMVMTYQLLCLNVAINSYDNALLSLLMSNQFVEIKGSVFKKFEKDNLFQITCADIVERFTLGLMLFFVAFRNLIELYGSEFDFSGGFFLPKSFGWSSGEHAGLRILWTISYPVLTVMVSEACVDWLKHAFITKFNHIRPSVYERYTDVLCRDLVSGTRLSARKHSYVDQSPVVARRLGFASLPLAVLTILLGAQSVGLLLSASGAYVDAAPLASLAAWWDAGWWAEQLAAPDWAVISRQTKWWTLGFTIWVCIVLLKILIGINLVNYAARRQAGMEQRKVDDAINDFGRNPIGEGREEQKYNKELKTLLDDRQHNTAPVAEMGERVPGAVNLADDGKKKRLPLEELTRYTMVKTIW